VTLCFQYTDLCEDAGMTVQSAFLFQKQTTARTTANTGILTLRSG
jgi:hypothetical protein